MAVAKQEDEYVEPTFQPKLNKNYNSTVKMDSFLDRQNEFLQKQVRSKQNQKLILYMKKLWIYLNIIK